MKLQSWTCSNCDDHAVVTEGFNLSVAVIHVPVDIEAGARWRACSDGGGPYFAGVPAREIEAAVRDALGLPFLR